MMLFDERISDNSIFRFSVDIELMFATSNILQGEKRHQLCTQIYRAEKIEALKRKYHFLCEVYGSFSANHANGMFEHLLNYSFDNFSLVEFRDYLLNMDAVSFIKEYLLLSDIDEIKKVIEFDDSLEKFYFEHNDMCNSYIGLQTFFRQTKRFITEYFSFAEDLRTDEFQCTIVDAQEDIVRELEKSRNALSTLDALEYSQKVMGKTFYNRGPYSNFVFSPSIFVPYRALRFFEKDQLLFYSIRHTPLEDEMILQQLKTIADSTRLKIISLLNEREPLRGMDIATTLSITPSTVSHHMEQLKNAGLLNEEQVKNSKYYSISRNNVDELLNLLTETLRKK
ncbi:MAG: transcriptional regulator, ArsR family [Clostridiales bacterium]|jgi:DNA-binding transcriptional ArsR family regulator|nr:transcriptional regulator, ArsR family [Clostridiales bacterium]